MDSVEKNIEEYILGNFSKLPTDVLNSLLASLDPKSLLNICTSNKAFSDFCASKLGRKALDKASIQYIAEEAPLSKPIRSFGEQANLIKRGFTTVYNLRYGVSARTFSLETINADFGFSEDEGTLHFQIKGFPPMELTKVLVVVVVRHHYDYHQHEYTTTVRSGGVYLSMEDVLNDYKSSPKSMTDPYKENPRVRLLPEGENVFVFEIFLP